MRVLLLSASTFQEPHPVYPVGLDYVAASIASSHEVKIIDANLLTDPGRLVTAVRGFSPDVVGISLRNVDNTTVVEGESFLKDCRMIVETVRSAGDVRVILGGSGFSLFPERLLDELGADYGILGEGERLTALLSALEKGLLRPDLPGVVLRGRQPKTPPPWSGRFRRVDPGDNDHTAYYLKNGGILNLQTKRGCPFRCIYCTYPLLEGGKMRLFNPDEVGKTARMLQDAGAKFLFVTDSVFNAHETYSLAVAESIEAAGVSVPWGGFFAPRACRRDYYGRLAECGCTHVEFGTESLSEPMLKTYRKPFDVKAAIHAHRLAQEAGLHVSHYLLLGGPGETGQTVCQTLDNIERLSGSVFFFYCGIRILPGTQIHSIASLEGSLLPDTDLLKPVFYSPRHIHTTDIVDMVEERARGRSNWITPRAAGRISKVTKRMFALGHTGVLWERLIK